jgi:hypothetical protein
VDEVMNVVGRPALYRKSTTLAKGMTVPVPSGSRQGR